MFKSHSYRENIAFPNNFWQEEGAFQDNLTQIKRKQEEEKKEGEKEEEKSGKKKEQISKKKDSFQNFKDSTNNTEDKKGTKRDISNPEKELFQTLMEKIDKKIDKKIQKSGDKRKNPEEATISKEIPQPKKPKISKVKKETKLPRQLSKRAIDRFNKEFLSSNLSTSKKRIQKIEKEGRK